MTNIKIRHLYCALSGLIGLITACTANAANNANCTTNQDCPSGQYCHISLVDFDAYYCRIYAYLDRTKCANVSDAPNDVSEYCSYNTTKFQGTCRPATFKTTATNYIASQDDHLNWWSAKNFCEAHNASLPTLQDLGCGTDMHHGYNAILSKLNYPDWFWTASPYDKAKDGIGVDQNSCVAYGVDNGHYQEIHIFPRWQGGRYDFGYFFSALCKPNTQQERLPRYQIS